MNKREVMKVTKYHMFSPPRWCGIKTSSKVVNSHNHGVFTTSPLRTAKTETIENHSTWPMGGPKSTALFIVIIYCVLSGEVVNIRENTGFSPPRPQVVTGGDNRKVVIAAKNTAVQRNTPKNKLLLEGLE